MNGSRSTRQQVIGDTLVHCVGTGPLLVVVHGGPGFDHSYLVDWLMPFQTLRTLVFYDQHRGDDGATGAPTVSAAGLVSQLRRLFDALRGDTPPGVFAHSWGAYLVYEVLRASPEFPPAEVILCSPVGLTRDRFDASGIRLIERLPNDMLPRIQDLLKAGDGPAIMAALLPFYCAGHRCPPGLSIPSYSPAVYQMVLDTLGAYDCRGVAGPLPRSTLLLYGDRDIEIPEDTRELAASAHVASIGKAGHFPFAEQPEAFRRLVTDALKNRRGNS